MYVCTFSAALHRSVLVPTHSLDVATLGYSGFSLVISLLLFPSSIDGYWITSQVCGGYGLRSDQQLSTVHVASLQPVRRDAATATVTSTILHQGVCCYSWRQQLRSCQSRCCRAQLASFYLQQLQVCVIN
jgi:hypothetical protein